MRRLPFLLITIIMAFAACPIKADTRIAQITTSPGETPTVVSPTPPVTSPPSITQPNIPGITPGQVSPPTITQPQLPTVVQTPTTPVTPATPTQPVTPTAPESTLGGASPAPTPRADVGDDTIMEVGPDTVVQYGTPAYTPPIGAGPAFDETQYPDGTVRYIPQAGVDMTWIMLTGGALTSLGWIIRRRKR